MNINGKEIKEKLAKGFILLTLTGTLVSKNPVGTVRETVVHAAYDLTDNKEDAIQELKAVYKKYNKKYYTTKSYNKITKYYNSGVKAINKATTISELDAACEKYKAAISNVKPYYLTKYQKKMETKFLKSYKGLLAKNEYSNYNLGKIEDIKDEGIEAIYAATTKTKAKKAKNAKNAYTTDMKAVKNILDEAKETACNFINSQNISAQEKQKLIEQVNNMTDEKSVNTFLNENGYDQKGEIYVETNPNKLTVNILEDEDKFNEFVTKWKNDFDKTEATNYYSMNGNFVISSFETHKYMIYFINYQYLDKEKTLNEYKAYVDNLYEQVGDMIKYYDLSQTLDEVYKIYEPRIESGLTIDFDSIIIEDNNTKGIGKAINRIMKYAASGDNENLKKQLYNYFDNYIGKHIMADTIIFEVVRKKNFIDDEFHNDTKKQMNSLVYAEANSFKIQEEYFLEKVKKNKIYQK